MYKYFWEEYMPSVLMLFKLSSFIKGIGLSVKKQTDCICKYNPEKKL